MVIVYGFVGIGILGRTCAILAELWAPLLHRVVTYAYERAFGKGAHFTFAVGPIMTAVVVFFVLLVGGRIFQILQEVADAPYTYEESFYFFFVSLSTIGLGDYVPSSKMALVVIGAYLFFGMDKFGALVDLIVKLLDSPLIALNTFMNDVCCLNCMGKKARLLKAQVGEAKQGTAVRNGTQRERTPVVAAAQRERAPAVAAARSSSVVKLSKLDQQVQENLLCLIYIDPFPRRGCTSSLLSRRPWRGCATLCIDLSRAYVYVPCRRRRWERRSKAQLCAMAHRGKGRRQ